MKIIAGPCQHESLGQSAHIAQRCKEVCAKYGINTTSKQVMTKLIAVVCKANAAWDFLKLCTTLKY